MSIDLEELMRDVSKTAHDHGWWNLNEDGSRNMGEMIALMHSELSEALETWRDNEPALWYQHNYGPGLIHGPIEYSNPQDPYSSNPEFRSQLGKPCGLATEFADVIIRILDTCETLDIPLITALTHKAEYNKTRPYRHGGKLA